MRMTLARKGLSEHIFVVKTEAEITDTWKADDLKALGIIAHGIEIVHQTKIRSATTAKQAWDTLATYYNRSNLKNRVALTRRLHDFKMEAGTPMEVHLDNFEELIIAMQAVGDEMDESRQMVILLGSLPSEYDVIVSIIENIYNIALIDVKEKLLKEAEKQMQQEKHETAFKARFKGRRDKRGFQGSRGNGFRGKCFGCNKVGHLKKNCPQRRGREDEVMFMANQAECDGWLLDSGASSHMSYCKQDFQTYNVLSEPIQVTIADGATMAAIGIGNIKIRTESGREVTVTETLHIPSLDRRLLSVSKLTERGLNVQFQAKQCVIMRGNDLVMSVQRHKNVYKLKMEPEPGCFFVEHGERTSIWELWHARLGHTNFDNYRRLQSGSNGLPVIKKTNDQLCSGCLKGKQTVMSFPKSSQQKTTKVLQLVHSDVMGPMKTTSNGGARYLLTFVDDYSRFVTGYFLKKKSEVADKFIHYKSQVENQWGEKIKCVRSDNGTEFVNKRFDDVCNTSGIVHQRTAPYSPQQNGLAERMNRTIMEMARCMMQHKCVEPRWWGEACNTAIYIINRITNTAHPDTTAYEICYRSVPKLDHLRVFGSLGFAHIDKSKRTKLDAKSYKCMLLGYAEQSKAYRVLNLETGKIEISRSVSLDEREIDGIYERVENTNSEDRASKNPIGFDDEDADQNRQLGETSEDVVMEDGIEQDGDEDQEMESVDDNPDDQLVVANHQHGFPEFRNRDRPHITEGPIHPRLQNSVAQQQQVSSIVPHHRQASETNPIVFHPVLTRRSHGLGRTIRVPINEEHSRQMLDNYANREYRPSRLLLNNNDPQGPPTTLLLQDAPSANDNSDISSNDDVETFSPHPKRSRTDSSMLAFLTEISYSANVPSTYNEAVNGSDGRMWKQAIADEIHSPERNNTWRMIKRNGEMTVIGSKWVFAHKKNENGEIVRFKARLVAHGFRQKYGINFFETYSPVANINSIRIFLSVCCGLNYIIMQCDVDTAFLYGILEEDVYMQVPEGVEVAGDMVCKLNKSIYGLKQSAYVWNKTINKAFIEMGFKPSAADPCIYMKQASDRFIYICLYVDDMLIAAKYTKDIEAVKTEIRTRFSIKDLGHARYVLGMEIVNDIKSKTLSIKQSQYITDVARRFNQSDSKIAENPCDSSVKLSIADCPRSESERIIMERKPYRSLMGCLLYIATCTRPDVSFAVCHLTRFLENPGEKHWKSAIRILRYLRGTKTFEIAYRGGNNIPKLTSFCDADWGSDKDDRRSVSGVLLMLNEGPVVFKSKYQKTVALSSAEAEYMAMSLCVQEVIWARLLLNDLMMKQVGATPIMEDNQGAIALSKNVGYQARTKHIDIRHHFIREKVLSKEVEVKYIETKRQLADMLTKAIGTKRLQYLRPACGIKQCDSFED